MYPSTALVHCDSPQIPPNQLKCTATAVCRRPQLHCCKQGQMAPVAASAVALPASSRLPGDLPHPTPRQVRRYGPYVPRVPPNGPKWPPNRSTTNTAGLHSLCPRQPFCSAPWTTHAILGSEDCGNTPERSGVHAAAFVLVCASSRIFYCRIPTPKLVLPPVCAVAGRRSSAWPAASGVCSDRRRAARGVGSWARCCCGDIPELVKRSQRAPCTYFMLGSCGRFVLKLRADRAHGSAWDGRRSATCGAGS